MQIPNHGEQLLKNEGYLRLLQSLGFDHRVEVGLKVLENEVDGVGLEVDVEEGRDVGVGSEEGEVVDLTQNGVAD